MDILVLHQDMPGQFKHLAPALARDPANRVVFLARRDDVDFPGVRRTTTPHPAPRIAIFVCTRPRCCLPQRIALVYQTADIARLRNARG